jgi:hypothetical protein
MENTPPTAKEFLKTYLKNNPEGTYDKCMIEFAKLHVGQALKTASERGRLHKTYQWWLSTPIQELKSDVLDKDSIINAYSINKIR